MTPPLKQTAYLSATLFSLTVLVFIWTSMPATAGLTGYLVFLWIVLAAALVFARQEKWVPVKTIVNTLLLLTVVGATGWTASPVFLALYPWAVYLGVRHAPAVAMAFLLSLPAVMIFSGGEAGVWFYVLTCLAILPVLALSVYLRWRLAWRKLSIRKEIS